MTRRALSLPLITATADLPTPLTDEALVARDAEVREGLSAQLAPERVGDRLVLSVFVVTPTQASAFGTYVRSLVATPRHRQTPEARAFLEDFFGVEG